MPRIFRTTPGATAIPNLSRRRLLALPAAAALAAAGLPAAAPALAGEPSLAPAVQARLVPAMREAIVEARLAVWPFGAVLLDVDTGETVYRAHNVTDTGDPSAHAEVALMRGAGLDGIDLTRTVLVTSAESCPMCASCAVWAGIAGVVYGSSIPTLIRYGYDQIAIRQRDIVARSFVQMPVVGGILTDETDPLYAAGPPA